MSAVNHKSTARTIERSLLAALLASGLALVVAPVARAAEVIPSMAMTRNPDAGDDTRISYGLAVRGNIAPMLAAEIGLGYRKDELFDDTVESTQWPLTASLWAKPVPMMYAGGGVGWYNTTLHYPGTPALASFTTQKFGVHLGGGFAVPLGPALAIDMNGRYVYLQKEKGISPPQEFNPDFWSTTAGLAFRF